MRRASADLVKRRELRRRTDTKFLLSPSQALAFLAELAKDYSVLAAGDALVASYRTLYFDTPGLHFFHAHRCRRRVRHKVRIRHYLDRDLSVLEVKSRRNELQSRKAWRPRTPGDNLLSADDQAFISDHCEFAQKVQAQVWTDFERITLIHGQCHERVTIDLGFRVVKDNVVHRAAELAVVEVKQWPFSRATKVMTALRALRCRPASLSKYCVAVLWTTPQLHGRELESGLRRIERAA